MRRRSGSRTASEGGTEPSPQAQPDQAAAAAAASPRVARRPSRAREPAGSTTADASPLHALPPNHAFRQQTHAQTHALRQDERPAGELHAYDPHVPPSNRDTASAAPSAMHGGIRPSAGPVAPFSMAQHLLEHRSGSSSTSSSSTSSNSGGSGGLGGGHSLSNRSFNGNLHAQLPSSSSSLPRPPSSSGAAAAPSAATAPLAWPRSSSFSSAPTRPAADDDEAASPQHPPPTPTKSYTPLTPRDGRPGRRGFPNVSPSPMRINPQELSKLHQQQASARQRSREHLALFGTAFTSPIPGVENDLPPSHERSQAFAAQRQQLLHQQSSSSRSQPFFAGGLSFSNHASGSRAGGSQPRSQGRIGRTSRGVSQVLHFDADTDEGDHGASSRLEPTGRHARFAPHKNINDDNDDNDDDDDDDDHDGGHDDRDSGDEDSDDEDDGDSVQSGNLLLDDERASEEAAAAYMRRRVSTTSSAASTPRRLTQQAVTQARSSPPFSTDWRTTDSPQRAHDDVRSFSSSPSASTHANASMLDVSHLSSGRDRGAADNAEARAMTNAFYNPEIDQTYFEQCFVSLERMGSGSFGNVFKVRSREDGRVYAIKIAKQRFRSQTDRLEKISEVYNMQSLGRHPHCVQYYDAWEEQEVLYIQMEFCELGSLQSYARRFNALPEEQIWDFLTDIALGLQHVHERNFLHLDIKPENIFVAEDKSLKLGDFGIAYRINSASSPSSSDAAAEREAALTYEQQPRAAAAAADRASTFSLQHHPRQMDASSGAAASRETPLATRRQRPSTSTAAPNSPGLLSMLNLASPQLSTSFGDNRREGDSRYLAREVLQDENFSKAADIFSLGITTLQLATHMELPSDGPHWRALRLGDFPDCAGVSDELMNLIRWMMNPDPALRPTIDQILAHSSVQRSLSKRKWVRVYNCLSVVTSDVCSQCRSASWRVFNFARRFLPSGLLSQQPPASSRFSDTLSNLSGVSDNDTWEMESPVSSRARTPGLDPASPTPAARSFDVNDHFVSMQPQAINRQQQQHQQLHQQQQRHQPAISQNEHPQHQQPSHSQSTFVTQQPGAQSTHQLPAATDMNKPAPPSPSPARSRGQSLRRGGSASTGRDGSNLSHMTSPAASHPSAGGRQLFGH
ncbi:hypothetical protein CAOG_08396 [Capsaspora owczarzaki ATCC 30864]|uniref:non-specific serine/threonine protein kinase n=1 Tax=Capsaspora owczarzaki (strain ATCC 30864) TaxID=595528 RepID=A0A0D2WGL5_CAPO3|nr:hypothetical protein CAOG_08396 [Capsaspora owczarzaki ATCC 30864]KJE88565.1 WEE protein kinase [Capsaspora owczarzaki ATCC 30864]|eukprot:XP_011269966.1 hypothetical protein CAOG_08396 [Capsaspora owczarzaki ATCC 30864]